MGPAFRINFGYCARDLMGEHAVFRKYAGVAAVLVLFVAVAALLVRFCFSNFHSYAWPKMSLATGYLVLAVMMFLFSFTKESKEPFVEE